MNLAILELLMSYERYTQMSIPSNVYLKKRKCISKGLKLFNRFKFFYKT